MTSKVQMWLTRNGGTEKIRFPVLPESISVKEGSTNRSVDIQGLGEVVIKQDVRASNISFSSFFPAVPFPGVQFEDLTPPSELRRKIMAWRTDETPVQFMITGGFINGFFTIEDFLYEEKGGDIGTLHYTLTLKSYQEIRARQVKIDIAAQKATVPELAPVRPDNRAAEKTYTVVKGDNLWNIAKKHLGNGNRYMEIVNLNKDKIKNPNLIYPGQVFKLPG